ncbi:hypothetical protein P8610_16730 [Fictibacillus sp. UD]|uniref:hypothetical protein n=1 Tax=Fictibacillus sp. UD TaxID=3038777 RepID=UPI0037461E84
MKFVEKRTNVFLILSGILFVFSIFSMIFSFNSLLKDIVYVLGFLFAIIIHIYYRKRIKNETS